MFGDLQLLLDPTIKAYASARQVGEGWQPSLWEVAFWSLAYRLVARRGFFVEAFGGRLPFPEEQDIACLYKAMTARKCDQKIFGTRYINQGVERAIISLQTYVSMKQPTMCWALDSETRVKPSVVYAHLIALPHISDFYAWQVRT